MKIQRSSCSGMRGYALLIVMVFMTLSLLMLAGALNWTSQNATLTDRNAEYMTTSAAAEAATEKILVRVDRDYLANGEGTVYNNLSSYSAIVPTSSDSSYWSNYSFTNPATGGTGTYVARVTNMTYVTLTGQYQGLNGYRATYRIASNARNTASRYGNIVAGVVQDVAVESIPLFQFAIFYNQDMEIAPGANMTVGGRVHSNGNIWAQPNGVTLTFSNDVTSSGIINLTKMPADPTSRSTGTTTFDGMHDGGTDTLNLPLGTNGTSTNVNQVLQMPPSGELASSAMGTNRFYNNADVTFVVSNNSVTALSGVFDNSQGTTVPTNQWMTFMNTNVQFYNAREGLTIRSIQIDVGKLAGWIQAATNVVSPVLVGKTQPNIIYIADMRSPYVTNITGYTTNSVTHVITTNTSVTQYEAGVRLMDGSELPPGGLTVASPDPVYIWGNYNVTTNSGGTPNNINQNSTAYTRPAAIAGDAVTILSGAWADANAHSEPSATATTVNAGFIAGIVPTGTYSGTAAYSGGVENFPRFLENWGGVNFWYNGSMVVLFNSQIANAPWGGNNVYSPPNRNWAFDQNFYQENKLPPGTPQILFIERLKWSFIQPGSTNFNYIL